MRPLLLVGLVLGSSACKRDAHSQPSAAAHVEAGGRFEAGEVPEDFNLEATATLVRGGTVKDGKDLERELNRGVIARPDRDGDGRLDPIRVVETRAGDTRSFEVQVIPSSKRRVRDYDEVAIPVAVVEVVPIGIEARVTVRWADDVGAPAIIFVEPIVVGSFCHWVLIVGRPIFIGIAYVVIIEEVEHIEHRHSKHKKHKNHDD